MANTFEFIDNGLINITHIEQCSPVSGDPTKTEIFTTSGRRIVVNEPFTKWMEKLKPTNWSAVREIINS